MGGIQETSEGNDAMALTRDFKQTIRARAQMDPEFRSALLGEAVTHLLEGDLPTGKAVLRDFVNATVGFERLSTATSVPAKSLMRMLGPNGNPRASALLNVLGTLQRLEGIQLHISTAK